MSIQEASPDVSPNARAVFSRLTRRTPTISRQPSAPPTPTPSPSRGQLNKDGCHSPYAAMVLPQQQVDAMPPTLLLPAVAASWDSTAPPPPANAGTARKLRGAVKFFPLPKSSDEYHTFGNPAMLDLPHPKLFVGQMRFETTASDVLWLLQVAAGVTPLFVEVTKGYAKLVLSTLYDADCVRGLDKRVLFDFDGVWIAETEEEREALVKCICGNKVNRLPSSCMTVEDMRSRSRHSYHHQPNPPRAPLPSYDEAIEGDAARQRVASDESSGMTNIPSLASSPDGTPWLRPRLAPGCDSLAMSPVAAEGPRYAPVLHGSM